MNKRINRKTFLQSSLTLGAGVAFSSILRNASAATKEKTTQTAANGFFTLGKAKDHWWLLDPEGKPFFTLGLNHIDPASLRYPENIDIWRKKYSGSTVRWIEESVVPNLKSWGFNTVGWVQEVTVLKWRHSRPFTNDEYKALGMPYCHLLPFIESHQWEKHTNHFDFRSEDWKEWVDYIARSHCAELADDPNLVGYFYSDCPCWVHDRPHNEWRGPIFDPELLKNESGRKELRELASIYYKTTHDAVRRHDPHHLILGDRYEANAPIAIEVVEAALPYVDVFSFQDFRNPVKHLDEWYKKTGKPVLLADAAKVNRDAKTYYYPNNGSWYAETLDSLYHNPGCIGFHLCGAYQRNKARRRGLLDERENPDNEEIALIKEANEKITQLMASQFDL